MGIRVKICGVRDAAGLACVLEAGADAVGCVLAPSPRRIALPEAAALLASIPEGILRVLVLGRSRGGARERALACAHADLVQLEGADLDGERILPVERDGPDLEARLHRQGCRHSLVLVEGAASGRGVRPDWARVADATDAVRTHVPSLRIVLSGGLTPDSVAEAIGQVRPYAVDVSSGVECAPGIKDPARVRAFVTAAREA